MYPSLIMLGWMSIVCSVLPSHGKAESASVLVAVLTSWAAMASQAGIIEAGGGWKQDKDLVRVAMFGVSIL